MEPRPWNISITRSDSLVRVDVQTVGKSVEMLRLDSTGTSMLAWIVESEDDGNSAIHNSIRYIH